MTFEEFITARLGALVRYATVVTWDPHLAEDITQTVVVKVAERWARIGALDAPEFYIKRMIVNEFLSWRRRRAARAMPLDLLPQPAAADEIGRVGDRDAALRLVAQLPPKQRAVVALRFYEDMSTAQIADLMGMREPAVRANLSRALATLRGKIAPSLAHAFGQNGDAR